MNRYEDMQKIIRGSFSYEFDDAQLTLTGYNDGKEVKLDFENMTEDMFIDMDTSLDLDMDYDKAMQIIRGSKCYKFDNTELVVSDYYTGDEVRMDFDLMTEEMFEEMVCEEELNDEEEFEDDYVETINDVNENEILEQREKEGKLASKRLDKTLGDIRRNELYERLMQLPDRDLCEMIRAHFESHSTLSGEKMIKDRANQILDATSAVCDGQEFMMDKVIDQYMKDDKEMLARGYANTRIRETPIVGEFSVDDLKREPVDKIGNITVEKVRAELRNDHVNVQVWADHNDSGLKLMGMLPDKFLVNNPMNEDYCEAELQVIDYSNGKMKNVSTRVVVDTDLMSGDVMELDDDMLKGLETGVGLEQ